MSLFFQKKTNYKTQSLSAIAWKKFYKNKQGMFLLCFLSGIAVVAILGYLITSDSTPYANNQTLEICLMKPMSKVTFLEIEKKHPVERRNIIQKMLYGQPSKYNSIPISSYYFSNDSIVVKLLNESSPYDIMQYNITNTLYHITKKTYILGTDHYGRDVLSQLVIGARVSLSVGFVSVFIALLIGVFLGAISGYFRGIVDDIIMWFINVVWSIPTLLLVIAISFVLGAGFWQIFIAIGLTMWVDIARVVRGQVISLREKEFVEASNALGFRPFTIIFKHIIPNITGTIIVVAAANFASAVLTEASLSFLGIGVQPPMPSWGTMIKENYGYIIFDYAYLAIIPGFAIMVLVLCFMLMGNVLRDVMDVKGEV
jgi:peptide/nickel transport system permease protein